MSMTIHFITDDFEMKNRCLQTAFFPEDHTGEDLAQELKDSHKLEVRGGESCVHHYRQRKQHCKGNIREILGLLVAHKNDLLPSENIPPNWTPVCTAPTFPSSLSPRGDLIAV